MEEWENYKHNELRISSQYSGTPLRLLIFKEIEL